MVGGGGKGIFVGHKEHQAREAFELEKEILLAYEELLEEQYEAEFIEKFLKGPRIGRAVNSSQLADTEVSYPQGRYKDSPYNLMLEENETAS